MAWAIIIGIFVALLAIVVIGNIAINSLFHYTVSPAIERLRPGVQLGLSVVLLIALASWIVGFGWALLLVTVAAGVTFVVLRAKPEQLSFYTRKELPLLDA